MGKFELTLGYIIALIALAFLIMWGAVGLLLFMFNVTTEHSTFTIAVGLLIIKVIFFNKQV